MEANNIIVREYLESLKEDGELDRLLPILLRLMGFTIIRTPKETKGFNQQGKDIIAEGKDHNGISRRYYFEVKGYSARDITEHSFATADGIADSLKSAYFADYTLMGIPNFNNLPVKVVLIHNGIIKPTAVDVLNGFVKKTFQDPENEYERWDIHRLTDLFSKYLFSEYLLTEEDNLRLFKKTIALIDQPDYDLRDYKHLIDNLLAQKTDVKSRAFDKLFSTLNLVSIILWHNAKEADNLLHAIDGVAYTVLKTWAWILKHKLAKKKAVIEGFKKILSIQRDLLQAYFDKTLSVATSSDGLFSETGGPFEEIGYSLRSMDYLGWLLYYYQLQQAGPNFNHKLKEAQLIELQSQQKATLIQLIDNNVGTKTPILDRHSRPIVLLVLLFFKSKVFYKDELNWLHGYLIDVTDKINYTRTFRKRGPEFTDNLNALLEFAGTGVRPYDYQDKGSMLILILIELIVIMNDRGSYPVSRENFEDTDLQTAYPSWEHPLESLERQLFEGKIYDITIVESDIKLPEKIEDFKQLLQAKPFHPLPYQTDKVGFYFLRHLSYLYFHNDIPPDEWRSYLKLTLVENRNTEQ